MIPENDSSCLDRHVRSRADRYSDRRRRQRRRVVYPIPNHGHPAALFFEAPDLGSLVTWQHLGTNVIDAERAGHCLGSDPAITREEQNADAEVVERRNGTLRRVANPIGDGDETNRPAIRRHVERGLGLRSQSLGLALEPRRDAISLKQLAITHQHGATAYGRLYAVAGDGLEMGGRIDDQRSLLGSFDNGGSEWVLRLRIRCSSKPQNLCLIHAYRRNDVCH